MSTPVPGTGIVQRPSHSTLLESAPVLFDLEWPPEQTRALDAIVVPASRGAAELRSALRLADRLDVQLVALCSRDTQAADLAALAAGHPGPRKLVDGHAPSPATFR